MAIEILRKEMPVSKISRAMDIPRSSIYYRRTEGSGRRKSRISGNIEAEIIRLSAERTTYGYSRIWALLRNSGIHYVSTVHDGMVYLMSIKDCYSKKWISYEFSKTCTAKDCVKALEKAYADRFPNGRMCNLILRTDNGSQYISRLFMKSVKLLKIRSEYIQKHTHEDNGDIESPHNSLMKTDYIWVNDLETYQETENLMEHASIDYNTVRTHSSIDYLPPDEFERRLRGEGRFGDKFLQWRKR